MICFVEFISFIVLCLCVLWFIFGLMEGEPFHIFTSVIVCFIAGFACFSDKTKGVEFEVFEDRMNVYSIDSKSDKFKLDFKVTVVEDEEGDIIIPQGGDPKLAFYVDSADGNGRERVDMLADSITIKSLTLDEHPYMTLTYKYVKKGNFWYSASMKPFEDKVWWTLYIPKDAIVKEQ